jgi:hypothetical protein
MSSYMKKVVKLYQNPPDLESYYPRIEEVPIGIEAGCYSLKGMAGLGKSSNFHDRKNSSSL